MITRAPESMKILKRSLPEEDIPFQNTKARGLHYLIQKDQSDFFSSVKINLLRKINPRPRNLPLN